VSQKPASTSRIVHVRLDAGTAKVLRDLEKRLLWSPSRILREGIHALKAVKVTRGPRRIHGLGRFASGVPDLGTSKRHMEGFGA
jgi:hypothetical protein